MIASTFSTVADLASALISVILIALIRITFTLRDRVARLEGLVESLRDGRRRSLS